MGGGCNSSPFAEGAGTWKRHSPLTTFSVSPNLALSASFHYCLRILNSVYFLECVLNRSHFWHICPACHHCPLPPSNPPEEIIRGVIHSLASSAGLPKSSLHLSVRPLPLCLPLPKREETFFWRNGWGEGERQCWGRA